MTATRKRSNDLRTDLKPASEDSLDSRREGRTSSARRQSYSAWREGIPGWQVFRRDGPAAGFQDDLWARALALVVDLDQLALGVRAPGHSWPALSVVIIVDAVSRQRLTAAPSLSACALISLPR
jgi:hypothetical protein